MQKPTVFALDFYECNIFYS